MQNKTHHYNYYSLIKGLNIKNQIDEILIFDDINKIAENFNFNLIVDYPIRLGMICVIRCKIGSINLSIGVENYTVEKNMILLILPENIFQITKISEDFDAEYILMKPEFFVTQNDFKIALDLHSYFMKNPLVQLPEKDRNEAVTVINLIKDKITENDNQFLLEIVQTYIRILFYLFSNYLIKVNEMKMKTRKEEILEEFVVVLSNNFKKEQNVSWYASNFFISPKYFSKIIYEVSKKHAKDWIKDFVLLEAKALLNSSSLSIQQISNELNFNNQSHFGTFFKRYEGMTPKEYKLTRK